MAEQKKKQTESSRFCEDMGFATKEAFIRLRTNISFSFVDSTGCKIIGVTSAGMSEGKSTVAINLAYSLAQLGQKILLIDCDLRRPSLNAKLEFAQTPGLSNLLTDINLIKSTIFTYRPLDGSEGFSLIASGDIPPNPSELLTSRRMAKLLETMRTAYDYIILDLPPVGAVADAQTVSGLTDGMLVVVKEGSCPQAELTACITQLKLAKCHILGFVMNGTQEGARKKYGKHYGYSQEYYKAYYK